MSTLINRNNLVFKESVFASMQDRATGKMLWSLDDLSDVTFKFSADKETKTDSYGATISDFYKQRVTQVTGNTAFLNIDLVASQLGTEKKIKTGTTAAYPCPIRFTGTVPADKKTVTLANEPVSDNSIKEITIVQGQEVIGKFEKGATAGENTFTYATKGGVTTLTLPTSDKIKAGMTVTAIYYGKVDNLIYVGSNNKIMPKAGELWVDSIFVDKCDINLEYHGIIVLPYCQLDPNCDIPLNKTGNYSFTINSLAGGCSSANDSGVRIYIPGVDDATASGVDYARVDEGIVM